MRSDPTESPSTPSLVPRDDVGQDTGNIETQTAPIPAQTDSPSSGRDLPLPPTSTPNLDVPMDMIREVLSKEQIHSIEEIEHSVTLYLMDTGGQPEFQDILPLILQGPALHLVIFNASLGLDKPVIVKFAKCGEERAAYESAFTNREMIHQILSSLHFISERMPQRSQDEKPSKDHRSTAVLIGTHMDVVRAGKETVDDVSKNLEKSFTGCRFQKNQFLSIPEESSVFLPVDNMNGKDADLASLRNFLKQQIGDHFHPVELPAPWLFLHLALRKKCQGVISLEQCKDLAQRCGIARDDVTKILGYIHTHIGTVLYYEKVKGFKEIVICSPKILTDAISKLVYDSLLGNKAAAEMCRRTGEIPYDLVKRLISKDSDSLVTSEMVISLLESFNIVRKITDKLLMPCLLKPDTAQESNEVLLKVNPPPLLVRFDGNFIPVGIFSALVVELGSPTWELESNERFKNRVTFLVNGETYVHILCKPTFIEIRTDSTSERSMNKMRSSVEQALQNLLEKYGHTKGMDFFYGFYCPSSLSVGCKAHFAECRPRKRQETPKSFKCEYCSTDPHSLERNPTHNAWFQVSEYMYPTCNSYPPLLITVPRIIVKV